MQVQLLFSILKAIILISPWSISPGIKNEITHDQKRGEHRNFNRTHWDIEDTLMIELVEVDGGLFNMGCFNDDESACQPDETPVHQVSLFPFQIGKYEVTQSQFEAVSGINPSVFKNCGEECPVENISFYQAIAFCNQLSIIKNFEPCYYYDVNFTRIFDRPLIPDTTNFQVFWKRSANGFRLPSEAEWEFAARGGSNLNNFLFAGSNDLDEVAWNKSNSDSTLHKTGQKKANELGIYDMSGNVYEWCWDGYSKEYYAFSPPCYPTGDKEVVGRVIRGGSWLNESVSSRVANRGELKGHTQNSRLGFRLARGAVDPNLCDTRCTFDLAPVSQGDQVICFGDPIPILTVMVPEDQTVHWFDAPSKGNIIFKGLNYQPLNPGTYYAEAVLKQDESCHSKTRTAISVWATLIPEISFNQLPDCSEIGYTVSLTILYADSIQTNAEIVVQNENIFTLFYTDRNKGMDIQAFNGDCTTSWTQPAPNCGCSTLELDPPVPLIESVEYCPADQSDISLLVAEVPDGLTVQWYENPIAGIPLMINSPTFKPSEQGIFYAETFDPDLGCRSRERTPFYVFKLATPFIREYSRECDADETTYTVVLEIEGADAVLNSVGDLREGLNNLDTIFNIPITEPMRIIALNRSTSCQSEFRAIPPSCICPDIPAPVTKNRKYRYCPGEMFPLLEVAVPQNATANWYDAPDNGTLLLGSSVTFQPTSSGSYFVETYFPGLNCTSRRRIGIELIEDPISITSSFKSTCQIFEAGADTLFLFNQSGCDSLIITTTYFEVGEDFIREEEYVCSSAEIGMDTLLVSNNNCTEVVIVDKVIADTALILVAENDEFQFFPGESEIVVDLLSNDQLSKSYSFEPLEVPPEIFLKFEERDGQKTGKVRVVPSSISTPITFNYQICDENCSTICDEGMVTFRLECSVDLKINFTEVLTPNGDGKNDSFDPLSTFLERGCTLDRTELMMTITNQFGEVVFRTREYYQPWEGNSLSGTKLPPETYFFLVQLVNQKQSFSGFIDLIR